MIRRTALALLTGAIFFGSTAGTPAPVTTTTVSTVTTVTPTIEEDDPRWDCRTMGNHICGEVIYFDFGGELYGWDVNGDRPACFVEPDDTRAGYSVYFYPRLSQEAAKEFGFEVNCGPMPADYRPF